MMDRPGPATDTDPRAVIAAALARIEAAAARLSFADARAEEEARWYIAQGMRAIRFHARRASWRARRFVVGGGRWRVELSYSLVRGECLARSRGGVNHSGLADHPALRTAPALLPGGMAAW